MNGAVSESLDEVVGIVIDKGRREPVVLTRNDAEYLGWAYLRKEEGRSNDLIAYAAVNHRNGVHILVSYSADKHFSVHLRNDLSAAVATIDRSKPIVDQIKTSLATQGYKTAHYVPNDINTSC